MQTQFKIGDLVQLKSGSPIMTINKLADPNQTNCVECVWFDSTNNGPFYANFLEVTLIAEPLHMDNE
ncbi:YodC family protein [Spirosoma lituiforme]